MRLKLLGKSPLQNYSFYKGTDRSEPYYQDDIPSDASINQSFLWYVSHEPEIWTIADLSRLKTIITLYRGLTPQQDFELIEITNVFEKPAYGTRLLGFDVSNEKRLSLLPWGLDMTTEINVNPPINELEPLIQLVSLYFKPKLSGVGLFDDSGIAGFFLRCVETLQSIQRNLWENNENKFDVVAVWRVED